ncbi:MAG: putative membrane protein [Cellvibrionaceae bacterium]|jgi:uncharacterized membrane protein
MNELTELLNHLKFSEERQSTINQFLAVQDPADSEDDDVPWFMTALIGGSAWIAAILFIIFIFLPLGDSPFIAGLIPLAIAIGMNRFLKKTVFLEQLSLALGMTGQMIWVSELADGRSNGFFWLLPIIGIVLFIAHTGQFHRFFTTVVHLIVFEFQLKDLGGYSEQFAFQDHIFYTIATLIFIGSVAAVCVIWFYETTYIAKKQTQYARPLGFGLIITSAVSILFQRFGFAEGLHHAIYIHITSLATLGILLVLVYQLALKNDSNPIFWLVITAVLFIFPAWQTPGLIWAIIMLLLSWYRQDLLLLGIGVLATAGFLILFYYDLDITLLNKSYVLIFTGVAMLAVRFGWEKLTPNHSEVRL